MGIREPAWHTCGDRGAMRNVLRCRQSTPARWMLFNLACLDRVGDLLDHPLHQSYLVVLHEYANTLQAGRGRFLGPGPRNMADVVRQRRKDPLRPAKLAAAFALEAAYQEGKLQTSEMVAVAVNRRAQIVGRQGYLDEVRLHCDLLRDIFGNPFRPVVFDPRWRSEAAVALARTAYDTRNFTLLPILADALEQAG